MIQKSQFLKMRDCSGFLQIGSHMGSNVIIGLYKLLATDYIRSHNASHNVTSAFIHQRLSAHGVVYHHCPLTKHRVHASKTIGIN